MSIRTALITFWDLNQSINQGVGKITDVNGDSRIDAADILAPWKSDGTGGWADGISEDGDTAHLDDLVGWNFVNNTNNPFDDHGHGTHTAGTIGAMGNNGIGVVGVNWNVMIMPLKFLDSSGNGSDLGASQAIRYAADHGARVSNNSWGGGSGGATIYNAINYAYSKGDVFVAAAGNSAVNTDTSPNYPSAYNLPNIIAVAALNSDGTLASFSNYGATTVDVGAPGVNIYSTVPNNNYAFLSGTSMATPHVTGTIGLILSQHPTWSVSQIINQVLSTVTPDPNLIGKTVSGGIVNAAGVVANSPASSATLLAIDTTTHGTWKGAYGGDGYNVLADTASYPSYATVTPSGQLSYTWTATTTEVRGLQKAAAGSTDRVAAAWYSASQFSIDVKLTDGQAHQSGALRCGLGRVRRPQRASGRDRRPRPGRCSTARRLLASRTVCTWCGT